MSTTIKERNTTVDILRGVAMLLVVLGHTMTGSTTNSERSFLFNIVWSLQMPLFILISGYVMRYSRGITSLKELLSFIKRRTVAYMLPWCVWSFAVRGIIFGQKQFLDIKWLLWHMDSGYWFLVTIWSISIVFGTSHFFASRLLKNGTRRNVIEGTGAFYLVGMCVIAGVGCITGLSFLAIKLTLYYMPFFFLGYLYGEIQDVISTHISVIKVEQAAITVSLGIWLYILNRVSLFYVSDNGIGVLLRSFASLCGCCAICGLTAGMLADNRPGGGYCVVRWCGEHSLEIYLVHYLLLNLIKLPIKPECCTGQGVMLVAINYCVTILLVGLAVTALNKNQCLRALLFGKE